MKLKLKKSLKIILLVFCIVTISAVSFFYMALYKGFYASSDKNVGNYEGPANLEFLDGKDAYHVVSNKYGEPIFESQSDAFNQAISDYGEAIELIYNTFDEEYNLGTFSEKNYQMYMSLGWQLPTENEDIRTQGSDLTKFLDIYENGEKRWYLTSIGWVREVPFY